MFASFEGHAGVVEELITGGADVNVQTAKGQTALSLAKNRRHSDIVDLLEKAGAKDPIQ
jgi:ankyrin repeat protein